MQSLKKLHKILKQSKALKQLVESLQKIGHELTSKSPLQFSESPEHDLLCEQLEKIKLNQIQECFKDIPLLPDITAIIIKACSEFTLAFLMIPEGKYFGWHDHARMNGISRIIAGNIRIRSINPDHFQPFSEDILLYPIDRIRDEKLTPNDQKLSIIYPDSYNIHQIIGTKQSCFLDLLIPEYPDNSCHYYITCDQPIVQGEIEDKIKIKRVQQSCEQIIGLEKLAKIIKQQQKQKQKMKQKQKQKPIYKNNNNIIIVRNTGFDLGANLNNGNQRQSNI